MRDILIVLSILLKLIAESDELKVFFTTDGSKPNIHQRKIGGKEVTFKYKGPFSLRAGKRTVKAIAVARYDANDKT